MTPRAIRTALLLVWLCAIPGRLLAADSRPNFLFILTDDQRWDALGIVQKEQGEKGRFPWLETPNLDKLAREGVRFRNAFVVNSLCSPSRASFLTGTYGHRNGIKDNSTPLPPDTVTYASVLRAAGYTTGYVGKWHMDKQPGPRPGFDYSASYIGQGKYPDCPFLVNGKETATEGWVDDVATDYAIEFLRRNKEKPFVLAVGFKACHTPFKPPKRCATAYTGVKARPVPNLGLKVPYPTSPGHEKMLVPWFTAADSPRLHDYMRCVKAIDENVGRITGELDHLALADDTVVVFASDNGYYFCEHGLADKRTAYEESLRIPLLVRFPKSGAKGKVLDQMVLNIDLAPTFLDLVGVPVPNEMQGRSWRPLLEGKTSEWRHSYYYEYFYEKSFASPHTQAVRTDGAKLIKYSGHPEWTEMFDLAADPYETKNLIDDPANAGLRRELDAEFSCHAEKITQDIIPPSRPSTRLP